MTTYVAKVPTFEGNVWTGNNTEEFKAWAEPLLPAVPEGLTRVWDLIDNANDPDNVVVDGILRAQVSGSSMPNRTFFVLGDVAIAGPLYDGQPSAFGVTSMNLLPAALVAEQYEEV